MMTYDFSLLSRLFTNTFSRQEYLDSIVANLQAFTGNECVGIRLLNTDGTIPYQSYKGFSQEFWAAENCLSIVEHHCVCVRVITGDADPFDKAIRSADGSVWTNDLQTFSRTIPEHLNHRYRGKCIATGFYSLAVIPIRHNHQNIGLIHLADRRRNMLPAELIRFLESLSNAIGAVILRFNAEESLRSSEATLNMAIASTGAGIFDYYPRTGRIVCSDLAKGHFGLSPDASVDHRTFLAGLHHADRQRVAELIRSALLPDSAGKFDAQYRTMGIQDGKERWLEARGEVFYDEEGRAARVIGTTLDISDRRRAEEVLRESEERLRLFIEHAPVAIAMFDRDMRYLSSSRRWRSDYRLGERDLRGMSHYEVFPEIPERWKEVHRRGLNGERVRHDGDSFERADGSVQWLRWEVQPWYYAPGRVGGIVIFTEDITEERQATETIKLAKAAAEEATRAKSEFLACMSHEIRTPMTVFMAAIENLLQVESHPDRRQLLEMADQSAQRLRVLIDDILDFSRIEARRVDLHEGRFDLGVCIRNTVEMMNLKAREKNLAMELNISAEVPSQVIGDPDRLGQVLINLIGNAVKFTPVGQVKVDVRVRDNFLEFTVSDTGIGISEKIKGCLFQGFTQGDSTFTRKYGGTGLGLAISKGLVEMMGGRIVFESREGYGSVFTFTMPLKKAEEQRFVTAEKRTETPAVKVSAARILLVEDDPMIRDMLLLILGRKGWRTDTAETGNEAVRKWAEEDFDLILMDLQMPGMNGMEATRQIRGIEAGQGGRTSIIGLTANATREIQGECLAAGMDRVLVKPVKISELYSVVENYCPEEFANSERRMPPMATPAP